MKANINSEMVRYLNLARQYPAFFVSLLDRQLAEFINERQLPISPDINYETNQGNKAWLEAREFLLHQPSLPGLEVHEGLNASAREHAADLANNGLYGHIGSDNSTFRDRIVKHCRRGPGMMAEIIGADFLMPGRNHAQMTILSLIIDDGVPQRSHRNTIYKQGYHFVGCKAEILNDKVITVFNITEHPLRLRVQKQNTCSKISASNSGSFSQASNCNAPVFKKAQPPNIVKPNRYLNDIDEVKSQGGNERRSMSLHRSSLPLSMTGPLLRESDTLKTSSNFGQGKRITQKKQKTKSYQSDGCKVIETTTTIYYGDGTVEQEVEKRTIFL